MADWGTPAEAERQAWPALVGWFVLFAAAGLVVAYLNRHHVEQQSNYTIYVAMANYYRGLQHLDVLTYPTWGYPFVLILIRRYDLVAIPQVLLASVAMTALFVRLRAELPARRALALLFLLALPWYLLHSVKWPLSFAASFHVLGVVVLERALRTNSLVAGLAAGLFFGAGLYFQVRVSVPASVPVDDRTAEPAASASAGDALAAAGCVRGGCVDHTDPLGTALSRTDRTLFVDRVTARNCRVHFPWSTAAQSMGSCV